MTTLVFISKLQRHYSRFLGSEWQDRWVILRRQYLTKLLRVAAFLPLLVLAAGLRLLLLLLKPLVHVRFGRLHSFELGAYGIPMEVYLCQRDAGLLPKRSLDLFYHYVHPHFSVALQRRAKPKDLVCNEQLDRMITSKVRVWEPARALDHLNRMLSAGGGTFSVTSQQPYDQHGLFRRVPRHLHFTEQEEELGRSGLNSLGIEPGSRFVCFHARDGVWLHEAHPRLASVFGKWGNVEERNASIHNVLPAVEQFTQLGYYGVRMGKYVKQAIEPADPRIIDYATQSHSDFMDVYLSAKCQFFIGTNSGMTHLPAIFRTPMVLVNVYPMSCIEETGYEQCLFLPKLFYSGEKGRLLTFRETLDLGLGQFYLKTQEHWDFYNRMGLEILENTPEEIAEISLEMHDRLNAKCDASKEDEELHTRFIDILRSYPNILRFEEDNDRFVRIGTQFLRNHEDLLD